MERQKDTHSKEKQPDREAETEAETDGHTEREERSNQGPIGF